MMTTAITDEQRHFIDGKRRFAMTTREERLAVNFCETELISESTLSVKVHSNVLFETPGIFGKFNYRLPCASSNIYFIADSKNKRWLFPLAKYDDFKNIPKFVFDAMNRNSMKGVIKDAPDTVDKTIRKMHFPDDKVCLIICDTEQKSEWINHLQQNRIEFKTMRSMSDISYVKFHDDQTKFAIVEFDAVETLAWKVEVHHWDGVIVDQRSNSYQFEFMDEKSSKPNPELTFLTNLAINIASKAERAVICVDNKILEDLNWLKLYPLLKIIQTNLSFLLFTVRYAGGKLIDGHDWLAYNRMREAELKLLVSKYVEN